MAFGGGGANDLTIQVRVDEQGTLSYMDRLDGSIKKVENTAGTSGEAFSRLGASIITINQGAQLAIGAVNGIGAALSAIPAAIQSASRIDDIFSAFDTAAQKAGTFGDVLTTQLQSAVDGTVSKLDLLKNSNELLQAGLKPDQIVALTGATRSFADVLGTDTKGALDAVTDSLLKGNDRALKALGITVDNEAAARKYAAAHGVLAAKLTETQKVEATRNAVIEAMIAKEKELGKATLDSGDAIDRIGVIFSDLATDALQAIGKNKELAKALNEVADAVSTIDFRPIIDGITIVIAKAAEGTAAFAKFTNNIIGAIKITNKFFDIVDSIPGAPIDQILGTKDAAATALFATIIENVGNKLVDAAAGSDAFTTSLKVQREQLAAARQEYPKDIVQKVTSSNTEITKDLTEKMSNASTTAGNTWADELTRQNTAIAEDFKRKQEQQAQEYTQFFQGIFSEFASTGSIDFKKRLENAGIEFVAGFAGELASKLGGGFLEGLLNPSGIGKALADSISGGLAKALTDKAGVLGKLIDALGLSDLLGWTGLFARGGIFDGSKVIKAARGMVVHKPTNFTSGAGIGLMGEAGPEAILPLTRVNGRLGVSAIMPSGSDEVAGISQSLAGLPGSRQIDITLNVDANYGPGTQDILRAAGIDLTRYGTSGDSPGIPPVRSQRLQARRLANGRYDR